MQVECSNCIQLSSVTHVPPAEADENKDKGYLGYLTYSLHLPDDLPLPHWQDCIITRDFFIDDAGLEFITNSLEEVPGEKHTKVAT